MTKTTALLVIAATVVSLASGQLFNDLVRGQGAGKNVFDKTINFDTIKLNERPGAKRDYLPPEAPTYLPPKELPSSTPGPKYLPPVTFKPSTFKPVSYMPTMGTFPPTRYVTYSTRSTTTRKPMPPPKTLPPLTTTPKPTTGYVYEKPKVEFDT